MIRLSKLADYAVVTMAHMAGAPADKHSAADISAATGVPAPTVSKILGAMARGGLLQSHRGFKGGFSLAHAPQDISVADVVQAVEGPIAVTHCLESDHSDGCCDILNTCRMQGYWRRINEAIGGALSNITFAELSTPLPDALKIPRPPREGEPQGACHNGFGA